MSHMRSGCVVCGEELIYGQSEKLECFYCHSARKRNTFLAINETVNFLKENFSFKKKINRSMKCEFKDLNKECLKKKCPFYLEN